MTPTGDKWTGTLARRVMRWLVRRFYPHVTVSGKERIPKSGPVLICANHANSLLDPVMVGIAARRNVRFLAKAPLFDVPLLGAVMRATGMLPAYRGSDDFAQVRRNFETLDAAAQLLIAGNAVGLFPEGKSHDAVHVEDVRSGAARVAVQAAAGGSKGVKIIPLGINYEHKERFRSSVWIQVGEPIEVNSYLEQHQDKAAPATRAVTAELDRRLKAATVHLDEPCWEPFLPELETLAPSGKTKGKAAPIRRRKRIADAMNHFLATDRPRAEEVAQAITDYRNAVHGEGLSVASPNLNRRGWSVALLLIWHWLALLLFSVPALVGTFLHIVPFTVVRAVVAARSDGRKASRAHTLLLYGLLIYALWYVAWGWWMFSYFTTWFAATCLVVMPFLGLLSLAYWRRARRAAALAWHEVRFLFRRRRLLELRAQRGELNSRLADLATEYEAVSAPEPAPPKRHWRHVWFKRVKRATCAAVVVVAAWFFWHWYAAQAIVDPNGGVDLASLPRAALESQLVSDEKTLRAILSGLADLERKSTMLSADFAAGRRSYQIEDDNNALRQLLLSFINYRTALIRMIWRYQRYAQLDDETLRLRTFLVGYTAASSLYEGALKFVHQFARNDQTITRLNEGEPAWGIPSGLYDAIERNLASRANVSLFHAAQQYYVAHADRFAACGLTTNSDYSPFHLAILSSQGTAARLAGQQWQQETLVAAKDLKKVIRALHYEVQSAVSSWMGHMKIRDPRVGGGLISAPLLAQLRAYLQPGDIVLERRNWFVSNAFLPGYWPHATLYFGTCDDLARMGLDQDPRVRVAWDALCKENANGHKPVIIEAIGEGVVFSTLEHSIGTADAAAVLRPKLSAAQIKEAIAQAFGHAGKPYDFEFDFTTRDKLVCTELVFRSYGANAEPIHFPVKPILGTQTMPANEIVRKVKDEVNSENAELQFIGFIDSDEITGEARWVEDQTAFFETLERPGLTMLQDHEPVKHIGLFGWTLIGLILFCTAGNLIYYGIRREARA